MAAEPGACEAAEQTTSEDIQVPCQIYYRPPLPFTEFEILCKFVVNWLEFDSIRPRVVLFSEMQLVIFLIHFGFSYGL